MEQGPYDEYTTCEHPAGCPNDAVPNDTRCVQHAAPFNEDELSILDTVLSTMAHGGDPRELARQPAFARLARRVDAIKCRLSARNDGLVPEAWQVVYGPDDLPFEEPKLTEDGAEALAAELNEISGKPVAWVRTLYRYADCRVCGSDSEGCDHKPGAELEHAYEATSKPTSRFESCRSGDWRNKLDARGRPTCGPERASGAFVGCQYCSGPLDAAPGIGMHVCPWCVARFAPHDPASEPDHPAAQANAECQHSGYESAACAEAKLNDSHDPESPGPGPRFDMQTDLAAVINRHSAENGSNTPDFQLANYLIACLAAFDRAVLCREQWYGVRLEPGRVEVRPETAGSKETREGDVVVEADLPTPEDPVVAEVSEWCGRVREACSTKTARVLSFEAASDLTVPGRMPVATLRTYFEARDAHWQVQLDAAKAELARLKGLGLDEVDRSESAKQELDAIRARIEAVAAQCDKIPQYCGTMPQSRRYRALLSRQAFVSLFRDLEKELP